MGARVLTLRRLASLGVVLALTSCKDTEPLPTRCRDVDCSGRGHCVEDVGRALCICDDGYINPDDSTTLCLPESNPECDLVENTGCPDGAKCAIFSLDEGETWEVDCVPEAANPANPGEHCEYEFDDPSYGFYNNCTGGSHCTGVDSNSFECLKICSDDNPAACDDVYPDGDGGFKDGICNLNLREVERFGLEGCIEPSGCDPFCDNSPHENNPCSEGDICLPLHDSADNTGTTCFITLRETDPTSDDYLEGEGTAGDECSGANNCAVGFICNWSRCRALCDLSATPGDSTNCDFSLCGDHPGETGNEQCSVVIDVWEDLNIGACLPPDEVD